MIVNNSDVICWRAAVEEELKKEPWCFSPTHDSNIGNVNFTDHVQIRKLYL